MNASVRVGVVGTGFGARVVAPAFAATPGCEVVDVVSARDANVVAALCARADVDLISVHSPPSLHVQHVDWAIDAGHAVLCDKPFGLSAADAEHLAAHAVGAGVVALANFEFRHMPARRYVKDLIDSGSLGRVEHVSWTHVSSSARVPLRPYGWLFDRGSGGGWLGAWGSHAIDALRWWLGDIATARGVLTTTVAERPDRAGTVRRCDADDGFQAWLNTEEGTSVAIDSTFAAVAPVTPRVVMLGSNATAELIGDRRVVIRRFDGERVEWQAPPSDDDPHVEPMSAWAREVRDSVVQGVVIAGAPDLTDATAVARVMDAIRAR